MNQYITETASNLSTDMAIVLSKLFMRQISQNPNENQTGVSLWTLEHIEQRQAAEKEAAAKMQVDNDSAVRDTNETMPIADDEEEFADSWGKFRDDELADIPI